MIKTVKIKIFLILSVFLTFTTLNCLVSINYFKKLQSSIDSIMNANYDSVVVAQNMIEVLDRQDRLALTAIFNNNFVFEKSFEENNIKFLEWLYKGKGNITEVGEKDVLTNIENIYIDYKNKIQKFQQIKDKENSDNVRDYYYNNILPIFTKLKEECTNLLDINQNSMASMKDESKALASNAKNYVLIISLIILLIGLSIIGYLLKKIIHPIEDLTVGIKKVSEGDYNHKIPLNREKEINYVLEEFNHMVMKLKDYERLNINEILMEKQKTEAIIESINSPIIVTDYSNKVNMLNKSAERMLDVKEKSIINRHFLEGIEERKIFNIIDKCKEQGLGFRKSEDIELKQNNKKVYYRVTSTPIIFHHSENIGTVTILQDITKFKEVEKMKSEFIAAISHELRTPLTSISMAVSMLIENQNNFKEDDIELIEIIKSDSERLNSLVLELLDLNRIESGKMKMKINEVNIKDIIDKISNMFKIQLNQKNAKLIIDISGVYRTVKADITKISWVIVNLISNAIRYIKSDGSGIIEIKAREVNNEMLISIKDNGEGISIENQEKIFEKFVQLKDENGQITGTSGLGLAICKEIVKEHYGDIWVNSTLGEGSKFYFTLKLGGAINEKSIDC
ncbi:MAG: PAS domain-containing protein [Clostridium baratii]|uniref:histidine kinase n=1 Tax=Clostridium baratii str. Sullivan TaxID=1415775 RepID=A0A0A7FXW5_9CLOT|nr:ATP-binding protein [Clostridium baratii]AIY84484.1 sensory box protein [Clostridium baratii str. Sullivan]MBS6006311.1 PAS domain-containing protein [Clostridium baratii]MDU1054013.1 ATP-binding protein [Clostridium baratii]MDU4912622.1 ATP-binding protein [Clostridium baratii]